MKTIELKFQNWTDVTNFLKAYSDYMVTYTQENEKINETDLKICLDFCLN